MSDAIITAVVGPLIMLIVGWFLNRKVNRVEAHTAETLNQVKNSHQTNLRNDIDDIRYDIASVHDEVRGVRIEVRGLHKDDEHIREDVRRLEDRVRKVGG